jgi:hypothetical protein
MFVLVEYGGAGSCVWFAGVWCDRGLGCVGLLVAFMLEAVVGWMDWQMGAASTLQRAPKVCAAQCCCVAPVLLARERGLVHPGARRAASLNGCWPFGLAGPIGHPGCWWRAQIQMRHLDVARRAQEGTFLRPAAPSSVGGTQRGSSTGVWKAFAWGARRYKSSASCTTERHKRFVDAAQVKSSPVRGSPFVLQGCNPSAKRRLPLARSDERPTLRR